MKVSCGESIVSQVYILVSSDWSKGAVSDATVSLGIDNIYRRARARGAGV